MHLLPFFLLCGTLAVPVFHEDQGIVSIENSAVQVAHRALDRTRSLPFLGWTPLAARAAPALPTKKSPVSAANGPKSAKTVASGPPTQLSKTTRSSRQTQLSVTTQSSKALQTGKPTQLSKPTQQSKPTQSTTASLASATATSSVGSRRPVIIIPKDGSDQNKFKKAASDGKTVLEEVKLGGPGSPVWFWTADMTTQEIQRYNTTALGVKISLSTESSTSTGPGPKKPTSGPIQNIKGGSATKKPSKRAIDNEQATADDPTTFFQADVPYELAMLSQSRHSKQISTSYRYNQARGIGVDIYYIDSGLNAQHRYVSSWKAGPDQRSSPNTKFSEPELSWIKPDKITQDDDDDKQNGHGSASWSKLVGGLGVAKYANVIVGKPLSGFVVTLLDDADTSGDGFQAAPRHVLVILAGIVRRIKAQKSGAHPRPAVVSISVHLEIGNPEERWLYNRGFLELRELNVPVFYAARNAAAQKSANNAVQYMRAEELPTTSLSLSEHFDNFFVVGAVDQHGAHSNLFMRDDPDHNLITFYAPGVDITCIAEQDNGAVVKKSGTSFATPLAAGLAAYFLSQEGHQNWTPQQVKAEMDKYAWNRVAGGPKVIANEYSLK